MGTDAVTGNRLSILLVSVGNVAGAAAQWYMIWLIARFAGPEAVGVYSLLIAVMSPIFITAQLGLRNLYITLQAVVAWRVYACLRLGGILVAGGLAVGALVTLAPEQAWTMGGAILVIKIASSTADLYFARIQRTERMRTFGVLLLLDAICTVVVTAVVVLITDSVITAVWACAVVAVGTAVMTYVLASAAPPEGLIAERSFGQDVRLLVTHGVPLAMSQGIHALLAYLPIAIVGLLGTTSDIGVFSSAAYLVTFAHLVGASVQTAILPDYRRRFEADGPTALRRRIIGSGYVAMASLSPLIAVAVVAGPGLLRLVYGEEFEITRSAVLFFALAAVICLPTSLLSSFHLVLNRYWVMTVVGAGSVLVVAVSGSVGGLAGMGAVEAGSMSVLASVLCGYIGAHVLARRYQRRVPSPVSVRSAGGGSS